MAKAKYKCIASCWHHKKKWRIGGDDAEFDNDYPKDADGNLCHFVLIESSAPKEVEAPVGIVEVKVNRKSRRVK